jgi:polysaccharide export outer membrane protein
MFRYKIGIVIILLTLFLSSCISNKKYIYMQDKGNSTIDSSGNIAIVPYTYKLQKGDILYLALTTDDERMNKIFVPGLGGGTAQNIQQGANTSGTPFYFIGFTIDSKGDVEMPYLGHIKVEGLEIEGAKHAIELELKKYFKVFYLQAKVADYKFSVLGYVNRPGQYFFNQNKVNIMEAIALAGDLQSLAKRYQIILYRQTPTGVKEFVIDLTDKSLIASPCWFVQPNDLIYVQPLKVRNIGDLTSLQSSFTVISPLLTSLLLVLNTYVLVKNLK